MTVKLYKNEVDSMIKNALMKKGLNTTGQIRYYPMSNGDLSRIEVAVDMIEPELPKETSVQEVLATKKEAKVSPQYGPVP